MAHRPFLVSTETSFNSYRKAVLLMLESDLLRNMEVLLGPHSSLHCSVVSLHFGKCQQTQNYLR